MKTRNGFVSNSSSSSFMISVKYIKDTKFKVEGDLRDFCKSPIKTVEELDRYFTAEYGFDTIQEILDFDGWMKEKYEKAKKAIENGRVIFIGSTSSEDYENPLENYIYMNGVSSVIDTSKIDLIEGE